MAGTWRGSDYYVDGKRIAWVVPLSKRPGWSVVVNAPNAPDKYVADPSGDGARKWVEQNASAMYEKYSSKAKDTKALDSAKRARMHRALDAVMDSRGAKDSAKGMTSTELRDEIRAVRAQISGGAGIMLKCEKPERYEQLEKRLTELLDAASYR